MGRKKKRDEQNKNLTPAEFAYELQTILENRLEDGLCDRLCIRIPRTEKGKEHVDIELENEVIHYDNVDAIRAWMKTESYKKFVERHAPNNDDALEHLAYETYKGITLGDDKSLSVHRGYKVKLAGGFKLEEIAKFKVPRIA